MFSSQIFFNRIKFSSFSVRFRSISSSIEEISLIDQLNQLKTKDLTKIFNENEKKHFLQVKKSFGGKFQSIDQLDKNQIDVQRLRSFLSDLTKKNSIKSSEIRIHVEPRLTPKNSTEIKNVMSVDFNSSYLNYSLVSLDNEKFRVDQWNSIKMNFDRKFHFRKTFDQFSDLIEQIPLDQSKTILLEDSFYRYSNARLISYLTQIQQIRCVLHSLIHCYSQMKLSKDIFHINGRDVFHHFRLFVGNEQSSAEFFLTNLIFRNSSSSSFPPLSIDDRLKKSFFETVQGQREPMAQCLLRSFAFLQLVEQKRNLQKISSTNK